MTLSNTAVPIYYGQFRDAVLRGDIPICKEIEMEMNRIDALIANPNVYYDDEAVEGFIRYCENELTLTDGGDLYLLPSFKVWAEQIFGWWYFVERQVYQPSKTGFGGKYVTKTVKRIGPGRKGLAKFAKEPLMTTRQCVPQGLTTPAKICA